MVGDTEVDNAYHDQRIGRKNMKYLIKKLLAKQLKKYSIRSFIR